MRRSLENIENTLPYFNGKITDIVGLEFNNFFELDTALATRIDFDSADKERCQLIRTKIKLTGDEKAKWKCVFEGFVESENKDDVHRAFFHFD